MINAHAIKIVVRLTFNLLTKPELLFAHETLRGPGIWDGSVNLELFHTDIAGDAGATSVAIICGD